MSRAEAIEMQREYNSIWRNQLRLARLAEKKLVLEKGNGHSLSSSYMYLNDLIEFQGLHSSSLLFVRGIK